MATNNGNDFDDDFDDDDIDTQQNGGDSNLLKQLRKAKRADEKRIKELTEQLDGLSKAQRERTVKEVLTAKGVNPKAAKFIMQDLQDVSEDSVSSWLNDNADLFGLQQQQVDPEKQADLAALRQQDIVTQGALTPTQSESLSDKIDNASYAELINLIQSGKF